MNHQGLLWNVHCSATVVLRKQLNLKGTVIRSKRFVETFLGLDPEILIWSGFLCLNERNYGWVVMNENTAEFWNLFVVAGKCNKVLLLLFVSVKW